ncbi:hypothetical protein KGQ71_03200 [Patescibacteria group bacterium]|nr:hypothetical protein [Patescibacteria group bacterium]
MAVGQQEIENQEQDTDIQLSYDRLYDDIFEWLKNASKEEILEYVSDLPETRLPIILEGEERLTLTMRAMRTEGISAYFDTNAIKVLPEVQLVRFVASLSGYNPESVIRVFQKKYPQLQCVIKQSNPSGWADGWIRLWRKIFYLLSAPAALRLRMYLKSLLEQRWEKEKIEQYASEAEKLIRAVGENVASNNYLDHPFPLELQKEIAQYLEGFGFLPKSYTDQVSAAFTSGQPYELLSELFTVLQILEAVAETGNIPDEERLFTVVWDELALGKEGKNIAATEQIRKGDMLIAQDGAAFQRFRQLNDIVTIENIRNGSCEQFLRGYVFQLLADQKTEFLDDLDAFLRESLVIQTLFGLVDPGFFLERIRSESAPQSRLDFIASLQDKVSPAFWPLAQQAMVMIAHIF